MNVSVRSDLALARADFLAHLKGERGLSRNTVSSYALDLTRFVRWVGTSGLPDWTKPTWRELGQFLQSMTIERLSTSTIARHVAAIRQFYRFLELVEMGSANGVDLLQPPKLWQRIPRALSRDQVERLIGEPLRHRPGQTLKGDRERLRDTAVLEFLYATGCRASELVAVRLRDVDLATGVVQLLGKGSKERLSYLTRPAVESIREFLRYMPRRPVIERPSSPDSLLFPSRRGEALYRNNLTMFVVKKWAQLAGLPSSTCTHALRHTAATHLLQGGMELECLQVMLGHSSIIATGRYCQVSIEHLQNQHRQFHPRGNEMALGEAPELSDLAGFVVESESSEPCSRELGK